METRAMYYCKLCVPDHPCDAHLRGYLQLRNLVEQTRYVDGHGIVRRFIERLKGTR